MSATDPRLAKLSKLFGDVIRGKQAIGRQNYALFLEAIYLSSNAAITVHELTTTENGIQSLQYAFWSDFGSLKFMNGHAAKTLQWLSNPVLAGIGGGSLLSTVVLAIVDPSIFWTAFTNAFKTGQLQPDAQVGFAWTLLQLLTLPDDRALVYLPLAEEVVNTLLASSIDGVRSHGHTVKHVLDTRMTGSAVVLDVLGPGGRHDNDKVDFRDITILPTRDELACKERPFLRKGSEIDDIDASERLPTHLDNQFRLLREDMLYEMREEMEKLAPPTPTPKKGKRKPQRGIDMEGFDILDAHYLLPDDKQCRWGITLRSHKDLARLQGVKPKDRLDVFRKDKNFLRHQSMTCLIADGEIIAFPALNRVEELLAKNPPVVVLQFEGPGTVQALMKLQLAKGEKLRLVTVNTAVFAYEPVLKALQDKSNMPLMPELLNWSEGLDVEAADLNSRLERIVRSLQSNPSQDIQHLLNTSKSIILDGAQASSLISGLSQRVSLIQGPPGTGKSFIGALLAKALHDFTEKTILVVCYTNHALDQFLEDLINIGIPQTSLVRLGAKSTAATEPLLLSKQAKNGARLSKYDWREIESERGTSGVLGEQLLRSFQTLKTFSPTLQDILEHLRFEYTDYSEAFEVPSTNDGMQQVGRRGRAIGPDYLLQRWSSGFNAGVFLNSANVSEAAAEIWGLPIDERKKFMDRWRSELMRDHAESVCSTGAMYNDSQRQISRKFDASSAGILEQTRIIGCTTTAAAKYRDWIRADVLLVEEAGEILESHVLTAMGPETEQLILIGDHKQLRPKINNYALTVVKGDGYDLNLSLFERLVLKEFPHEILLKQHRMRPEISNLVRQLTYPELKDDAKTQNRPLVRGVDNTVIWIDHAIPEDAVPNSKEAKDPTSQTSKQNGFEVKMVLKILRYLGQQGYKTDSIVILTPYLGQLRALQEALKEDNDPILSDLDSGDLIRAGLLTSSNAKIGKKQIRISTIDNYQGEESDIVIASLTRSNPNNDIGFMGEPERLNVLLSRARNALIMIGNSNTFINARKGAVWTKLMDLLRAKGSVYDGLPVHCERHPTVWAMLKTPEDFDLHCPEGGCTKLCGSKLKCGMHSCPSKCHIITDHSKMPCPTILHSACDQGHRRQYKCDKGPPSSCAKCDQEAKAFARKQREEYELQEKREAEERAHAKELADLDAKIAEARASVRDAQLAEERKRALEQKELDLANAAEFAAQAAQAAREAQALKDAQPAPSLFSAFTNAFKATPTPTPTPAPSTSSNPPSMVPPESPARKRWERQKAMQGAVNTHIDEIMALSGLEAVKEQVLTIKAKVDTSQRQGTSLKGERFGVAMLGNPGTGKTTVARLYGKFLASVQVIPSDVFFETTGSRLGNGGVPALEKELKELVNGGGGTMFIDEAYQLTSEQNFGGRQVLDYLLAEIENLTGKIIFIFAGYDREMEKFFEHNPGIPSRVPYKLQFKDYEDSELLGMLQGLIHKRFHGRMQVQEGITGLFARIVVRRLGRGRGKNGFGNARALATLVDRICSRQADRLELDRSQGNQPDDFFLTRDDLLGPPPSQVKVDSKAWRELQKMIGLGAIKQKAATLFKTTETNFERELKEKAPSQVSLNGVFMGNPGTGKTTVAKLYGQILVDLGLLSNGEVVVKNPADFIGSALGQSESQTKAILANTVGKVLVIDEAYMLYGGTGNGGADSYKTAVIDTIVAEVQNVAGEDRCVLMLGYKRNMEEMFQNVNPGLTRRFSLDQPFQFDDYNDAELLQAMELKLKKQDLTATDAAKRVAIKCLARLRNGVNFGNIGAVDNLLNQAKIRLEARQAALPAHLSSVDAPFEPQDFDPDFDRGERAAENLEELFKDVVGCEDTIQKLRSYQEMARNMEKRGQEPRTTVPTTFIFKGPPGTGKTTTARKIGTVYFDMGFLSSTEVIECSVSDLVGQYVGQTGPKTQKLLEKALGRVLFVDEAYRLSEGQFAKEAMDELVSLLTHETYRGKVIVILAGYTADMNNLMAVNSGLSSRFPTEIIFPNMSSAHCLEVLKRQLKKHQISIPELEEGADPSTRTLILALLDRLATLDSWGNARDMETLSKQMTEIVFTTISDDEANNQGDNLSLKGSVVVKCVEDMLDSRMNRANVLPSRSSIASSMPPVQNLQPPAPQAPIVHTTTTTTQVKRAASPPPHPLMAAPVDAHPRDPGVTDAAWAQLQLAKQAAADEAKRAQRASEQLQIDILAVAERARAANRRVQELKRAAAEAKEKAEKEKIEKKLREERAARVKADEERARLKALLEAEQAKKRKEEAIQVKLRSMGVCVAGFQWIKSHGGYRCGGGSHFVSAAQLGM